MDTGRKAGKMSTYRPGDYTRESGLNGEDVAFDHCQELCKKGSIVRVYGGSPFLCADLIEAGANVVLVLDDLQMLYYVQEVIASLLFPEDLDGRFRTECLLFLEDAGDLADQASVVVYVGLLHHTKEPQKLLEKLVQSSAHVVVIDTTEQMMEAIISYELRVQGYACDHHYKCRDAARTVSFCRKEDIEALLDCIRVPRQNLQYKMISCWCGNTICGHQSNNFWCLVQRNEEVMWLV